MEKVENIETWSGAILNHEIVILRLFLTAERHLGRPDVSPQQVGLAEAAWLPEGQDSLPRSSSGVSNGLFFMKAFLSLFQVSGKWQR